MSDWGDTLLPPNQTPLEAAVASACVPRVSPDIVATLWDASGCSISLLPWLAWSLSVDDWDESWNEVTQRRVIASSIDIHRKKGTVFAVKSAIATTGYRAGITEWWQQSPEGVPHTFGIDIEVDDRGIDEGTLAAVVKRIDSVKPVRSHYTLRMLGRSVSKPYVACATLSGDIVSISPYQIGLAVAPKAAMTIGIGIHDQSAVTLYPRMN